MAVWVEEEIGAGIQVLSVFDEHPLPTSLTYWIERPGHPRSGPFIVFEAALTKARRLLLLADRECDTKAPDGGEANGIAYARRPIEATKAICRDACVDRLALRSANIVDWP